MIWNIFSIRTNNSLTSRLIARSQNLSVPIPFLLQKYRSAHIQTILVATFHLATPLPQVPYNRG